jgi:hypothetical protein
LINKIHVGSGDNVVQHIKAHSLNTLFAVFEKNYNNKKSGVNGENCQERTYHLSQHEFYFPKLDKVIKYCHLQ